MSSNLIVRGSSTVCSPLQVESQDIERDSTRNVIVSSVEQFEALTQEEKVACLAGKRKKIAELEAMLAENQAIYARHQEETNSRALEVSNTDTDILPISRRLPRNFIMTQGSCHAVFSQRQAVSVGEIIDLRTGEKRIATPEEVFQEGMQGLNIASRVLYERPQSTYYINPNNGEKYYQPDHTNLHAIGMRCTEVTFNGEQIYNRVGLAKAIDYKTPDSEDAAQVIKKCDLLSLNNLDQEKSYLLKFLNLWIHRQKDSDQKKQTISQLHEQLKMKIAHHYEEWGYDNFIFASPHSNENIFHGPRIEKERLMLSEEEEVKNTLLIFLFYKKCEE